MKTSPPPPFLLLIYIYILLLPPSGGTLDGLLLRSLLRPLKICIPFVAVPKKSKKRQAKTPLLQNRSTPIALAARPAGFFSSSIFQFSIKNRSFRSWLSLKSRKKRQAKTRFSKKCIWLRAVPKKSKKRQAKTLLLKIRSTPIALAALPADFSIFSVPPLCQFSFEKPMIF